MLTRFMRNVNSCQSTNSQVLLVTFNSSTIPKGITTPVVLVTISSIDRPCSTCRRSERLVELTMRTWIDRKIDVGRRWHNSNDDNSNNKSPTLVRLVEDQRPTWIDRREERSGLKMAQQTCQQQQQQQQQQREKSYTCSSCRHPRGSTERRKEVDR